MMVLPPEMNMYREYSNGKKKNHHWMLDKTTKIGDSTSKHEEEHGGWSNWWIRIDKKNDLTIKIGVNQQNGAYNWILRGLYGNINMHQLLILPFTHITELENIYWTAMIPNALGIFMIRDMGMRMNQTWRSSGRVSKRFFLVETGGETHS